MHPPQVSVSVAGQLTFPHIQNMCVKIAKLSSMKKCSSFGGFIPKPLAGGSAPGPVVPPLITSGSTTGEVLLRKYSLAVGSLRPSLQRRTSQL